MARWIERWEVVFLIFLGVVLVRVPTFFEPYWYGDEAIYLTVGQAMNRGVELYKGIHDNKPPGIYWIAAIGGGSEFWFKLLTAGWNGVTVLAFWWLAGKIWKGNKRARRWTTVVFALVTNLPMWEGNIANAELFFLLPAIVAAGWLWEAESAGKVGLAGLMLGVGALFKMPVVLEAAVWPVVWIARRDKDWLVKSTWLGLGMMLPVGLSLIYFQLKGAGEEYWAAAWKQNLPYLSSWRGDAGWGLQTLKGRAVVWGVAMAALAWRAGKWSKKAVVIAGWWITTLFAALLSGRPYPHYLLQMAAPVAMGAGAIIWGEKEVRKIGLWGAVLALIAVWGFGFWVYPTGAYYRNYWEWVVGIKSQNEYFAWFGGSVNRNYEIARVVRAGSGEKEKLFVWGDEPMIYALAKRLPAGRYTVAYHIKDFGAEEETIRMLGVEPPRYIVVVKAKEELPGLRDVLSGRYILEKKIEGVEIYRRILNLSLLYD